jgi:SAM-dependent methyltransferase
VTPVSNQDTFGASEVVSYYGSDPALQPPEQRILDALRPQLGDMSMLDIGVGTGRTTKYFAPLVRRYVGVDYAPSMVAECERRFGVEPGKREFRTADARDLRDFAESSLDFVLFSYNGIDYISHEDRLRALAEIARVLRPGGTFVMSAHNILALPAAFDIWRGLSLHPLNSLRHLAFQFKLRRAIPSALRRELQTRPWAVVNDGAHEFRVETYYLRPSEQIRQLESAFRDIEAFRLRGGGERIADLSAVDTCTDSWIYFQCTRR